MSLSLFVMYIYICILSWLLMGLVLGKQYMHFFDRYWGWYNTPVFVGLIYLEFRRTLHQKYNLIAVGNARVKSRSNPIQQLDALRCVSGKFNYSTAGGPSETDTFFGRNVMPQVQTDKVLYYIFILFYFIYLFLFLFFETEGQPANAKMNTRYYIT